MLDVPAALLSTRQPERLATQQRDGLGLGLSQTLRRALTVGLFSLHRVSEKYMSEFVEQSLVRSRVDWGYRDVPVARIAHRVAIGAVKRDFDDVECGERSALVPVGSL